MYNRPVLSPVERRQREWGMLPLKSKLVAWAERRALEKAGQPPADTAMAAAMDAWLATQQRLAGSRQLTAARRNALAEAGLLEIPVMRFPPPRARVQRTEAPVKDMTAPEQTPAWSELDVRQRGRTFRERLGDLIAFKAVHGHADVPFNFGPLGWWAADQRVQARRENYSPLRRAALEALGFRFHLMRESREDLAAEAGPAAASATEHHGFASESAATQHEEAMARPQA